jgi:hypothetical protein
MMSDVTPGERAARDEARRMQMMCARLVAEIDRLRAGAFELSAAAARGDVLREGVEALVGTFEHVPSARLRDLLDATRDTRDRVRGPHYRE